MIRYHSFYAAHREGDYGYLMDDRDREMLEWVRAFNRYDLYSKSPTPPDRKALEPYCRDLVLEFFKAPLHW
jgi:inositol oxygenase